MPTLGKHILQTVDSTPIEPDLSLKILEALRSRGFEAQDIGHHISVNAPKAWESQDPWECAVIYRDGNTLWIKAIAQRWWCLFNLVSGDDEDDPKYVSFWDAIDSLDDVWKLFESAGGKVIQGTTGELKLR